MTAILSFPLGGCIDAQAFAVRRACREAAKLAKAQQYGPLVTRALIQEACRRAKGGTPPVIAARAVVRRADQPVFGGAA